MFKFGLPTLVLKTFTINKDVTSGPLIEIIGRPQGFMSWLLTAMKMSTLTTLKMEGDELSIVSAGLSGEVHTVIPVSAIESTQCGFSKQIAWLFVAALLLVGGATSGETTLFLFFLLLAAIAVAAYYLGNRMFLSVSAGNRTEVIQFKKGVTEGVPVDLERTLEAIGVINAAVLKRRSD